MRLSKRRLLSYIIGKIITGNDIVKIFDRTTFSFIKVEGEVTDKKISVYDTTRSEILIGSGDDTGISLYDFNSCKFLDLKITGKNFEGYDFETKRIFYGELQEDTILFFDFEDSKHHFYVMMTSEFDLPENMGLLI